MAQQTQIKTMLPYFARWMERFPDFESLASAPAEDVLKHWEGLGYYSRARNLHKLAQTYVTLKQKPRNREEWQQLPGIGPYTSAAISSIALGQPDAVVDGNVVRILARLTDDARTFKSNGDAVKALTATADELLDTKNPGDHNQAMMELGATVCLKSKPLCTVCPWFNFAPPAERAAKQYALKSSARPACRSRSTARGSCGSATSCSTASPRAPGNWPDNTSYPHWRPSRLLGRRSGCWRASHARSPTAASRNISTQHNSMAPRIRP